VGACAKRSRRTGADEAVLSAWRWALAAFALAALTGSLLRFGMLHGFPFGLRFVDVRHAHSHLMYFAWVTPALMLSIATVLRRRGLRVRAGWVVALTLVVGFAAYPPFLLSGYGTLPLAGRDLPVSMIVASLNGLAWYGFAAVYLAATWGRSRTTTLRAFDAALFLLLLASLGAVGLAVVGTAGAADPAWMAALVEFFLDLFGEGWFALGVLGLAYATAGRGHAAPPWASAGVELLTAGLVVRSLAALAAPTGAAWVVGAAGSVGAVLTGVGLLLAVWPLWRHWRLLTSWTIPLAFMTLKGLVEVSLAWPAARAWVDAMALRVLLLHAYLLGAVTLGLVAAARRLLGPAAAFRPAALVVAVLLLLASLLPLTGVWPRGLAGTWSLPVAAWASLLPVAALLIMLLPTRHPEPAP
jgi:hypothetical protein